MIHPLFKLIATRPQLLADHLEAYAELVADEVGHAAERWKHAVVLNAVAAGCFALGVIFGGVALMLWAVTPPAVMQVPWVLLAVPGAPLLIAIVCAVMARSDTTAGPLDKVKAQVRADIALFREASTA